MEKINYLKINPARFRKDFRKEHLKINRKAPQGFSRKVPARFFPQGPARFVPQGPARFFPQGHEWQISIHNASSIK